MLTVIRDLIQVDREKDCASADSALELGQQPLYVKPWSSYPSWVGKQQRRHMYLHLYRGSQNWCPLGVGVLSVEHGPSDPGKA
ncbi:hypothetical protein CMUS01_06358 [Colletotrichum musicola]|uniref:Uncharacterized protein n=2 Tax=Colletotrichum orchidearum species complex TaxID=2707337 RepID=A0A8H6KM24_9PEZI|nr:hypothetical protein CSOJ01_15712 [Colletotrichum sojae]KAF6833997.1 hypothetical protein CMUS01_06358 [Colletotrichum musicola]